MATSCPLSRSSGSSGCERHVRKGGHGGTGKERERARPVEERTLATKATDPVHDRSPAFIGNTLKNSEHRQAEVVEVGDSIVRSLPVATADEITFQLKVTLKAIGTARMRWIHHVTGDVVEARLMQFAGEQFEADDGVDDDDEDDEESDV